MNYRDPLVWMLLLLLCLVGAGCVSVNQTVKDCPHPPCNNNSVIIR